jgi:hypothetical protein
MADSPDLVLGLNAVILALTDEEPRVLALRQAEGAPLEGGPAPDDMGSNRLLDTLPTGPLDPSGDRTLELAVRRWVRSMAGLELGYVEQLYTFGDRFRDPREVEGGPRVISAAYLALVREVAPAGPGDAAWRSVYASFPWEDWRDRRPAVVDEVIVPAVRQWIEAAPDPETGNDRLERATVAFGLDEATWDGERVLDRYELLYEMRRVAEAQRDHPDLVDPPPTVPGRDMAHDHRRIVATALGRIRAKIKYRPVVFEVMPERFTLLQLQRAVEALAGVRLHKQNFRRLVEQGGLVEGTGLREHRTGGRPAELFRFRREVLLERPAPGVGLPRGR